MALYFSLFSFLHSRGLCSINDNAPMFGSVKNLDFFLLPCARGLKMSCLWVLLTSHLNCWYFSCFLSVPFFLKQKRFGGGVPSDLIQGEPHAKGKKKNGVESPTCQKQENNQIGFPKNPYKTLILNMQMGMSVHPPPFPGHMPLT